jgi:lipid II:glycine glycyltransferase (peptidoglycan interpeptide bridge formation enzyme)
MIKMITRQFSQTEWSDIVSGFRDLSLLQTWEYVEAKAASGQWKIERAVFMDGDTVVGAVQVLVRQVKWLNGGLAWVSRGPLWRKNGATASTLAEMLKCLNQYWVGKRRMYLRILPTLLETETAPGFFDGIGYRLTEGSITWSSSRVDLSQPLEVLRARLQQKWRNCLNKAERLGVTVESGTDGDIFNEVLNEYRTTLREKSFATGVTPDLLHRLQSLAPDERKLWALAGRRDGQRLGGLLIARYGGVCEYLVGAVNDPGKAVNAGQLLLWSAIEQMKERGYCWFDLGGMDPVRTRKGVLHFKKGVNGGPYQLVGEFEAFNKSLMNHAIRWRIRQARNAFN